MVEYNKLLYEIAVRFAANYLCQAKRAQTAHIKERSQMLECSEFIALHKPSEQLSSVSGWASKRLPCDLYGYEYNNSQCWKSANIYNILLQIKRAEHVKLYTYNSSPGNIAGGREEGLGYNRYISTLSDVPLAFLLIYGLLRSRRRRRRRASARKFFWRFSATSHSLTHLLTHSLTRAVALSFVLFSAVVTKASNFVANFKQIFRFALPLFVLSLSLSMLLFRLLCAKSAF